MLTFICHPASSTFGCLHVSSLHSRITLPKYCSWYSFPISNFVGYFLYNTFQLLLSRYIAPCVLVSVFVLMSIQDMDAGCEASSSKGTTSGAPPATSFNILRDIFLGHNSTCSRISVFHADLLAIKNALDLHAIPHNEMSLIECSHALLHHIMSGACADYEIDALKSPRPQRATCRSISWGFSQRCRYLSDCFQHNPWCRPQANAHRAPFACRRFKHFHFWCGSYYVPRSVRF